MEISTPVQQKTEKKSTGGIILADTAEDKSLVEGVVLHVGDGYLLDSGVRTPLVVKPGDIVFFSKFAGVEVDEMTLVMKESELVYVK